MDPVSFSQVLFLVSLLSLDSSVYGKKKVNCQKFKFHIDEDVIHDHILEGHVFKRLTVARATKCHVMCKDDCLCLSMNYFSSAKENNCELNSANKQMEPAAMKCKPGGNYYDLVRSYTVQGGKKYIPGKHECVNRCCRPNPCVNGGVCKEMCEPEKPRFNCSCPATHTGQRCEIKYPRSCKDVAEKTGNLTSGNNIIYNPTMATFPIYCDMDSEPGYVWTLIQSFSLGNKENFEYKGFDKNFPMNDENVNGAVNWTKYRLSLPHMQSLANHSTHLRVTCNYPSEGLQYTDYARAKLEGHDIFGSWGNECQEYEYVNIRGLECYNCTALTKNTNAWFIRSYNSKVPFGCDFDGSPGGNGNEDNFGRYRDGNINPVHRCSSSSASTTQHWFGTEIIL